MAKKKQKPMPPPGRSLGVYGPMPNRATVKPKKSLREQLIGHTKKRAVPPAPKAGGNSKKQRKALSAPAGAKPTEEVAHKDSTELQPSAHPVKKTSAPLDPNSLLARMRQLKKQSRQPTLPKKLVPPRQRSTRSPAPSTVENPPPPHALNAEREWAEQNLEGDWWR